MTSRREKLEEMIAELMAAAVEAAKRQQRQAPWIRCVCGNWYCRIHEKHVAECECPPVEQWELSPYHPQVEKPKEAKSNG